MQKVLERIADEIRENPNDYQAYEDMYNMCREAIKEDIPLATKYLRLLSDMLEEQIPKSGEDIYRFYELHKKELLVAAPHSFYCYLLYVEFEREPEKKFFLPRRKVLTEVAEAMQDLVDDRLDLLTVSMPPGSGKLLADDTPIFTPDGWKKHGDLKVGDYVFGADGKPKKVLHVFPKDYADYEVRFVNGDKIKCHGKHEWVVYDKHSNGKAVRETEEMIKRGLTEGEEGHRGFRCMFRLPEVEPLEMEEKELPVAPYVFGAWLGDGHTNKPNMTICDTDLIILKDFLKYYDIPTIHLQVGCKNFSVIGLRKDLKKLGLCQSRNARQKYIPEIYLTASKKQRLELLAGLIDTDGSKSRHNRYSYSSTNKDIIDGVCTLISSFGWRYGVKEIEPKLSTSGIQGKKNCYVVTFSPDIEIPCRVPRKRLDSFAMRRKIGIKDIKKCEPVQGNCIQVEGGVYLAGKTMLPTHNSTLGIFFLSWVMGRDGDGQSLASAHSGTLTRSFYDGVMSILTDPEYLYGDVFPVVIASTNSKEETIDLGRRHRFSTLTCRAINASLTGATRCDKILYADDLCSGIEEAMSKDRLDKLWITYTNDLKSRKKMGAKEIHIATRWSVHDVIGRLEREYGGSDRAKFIVLPALDENGESNFDYDYGVGFDTKYFEDMRSNLDDASFKALFMNEPIEREGLLYHTDELRRYYELPSGEPDGIIAVCDTKDKGKDYCSLPVAYVYGNDYYIDDVIFSNGLPEVVDGRIVDILLRNKVKMCRFESNAAGGRIADKVESEIKSRGGITHITKKFTSANKETKIVVNSAWVKEHCLFLDKSKYKSQDYKEFMAFLTSYTLAGKNSHDDAPDSVAMLSEFAQNLMGGRVEAFKRPW